MKSKKWVQNECWDGIAPIIKSKEPKGKKKFFFRKKAKMPWNSYEREGGENLWIEGGF